MSRILDHSQAQTIAEVIVDTLEVDGGFSPEEIVPGLVQGIVDIAAKHPFEEQILDEAANLLADGGVEKDA